MPAPLCFFCGRAGCRLRSTAAWRIRIKPAAMPCRPGTDRPAIDESSRRRRRYGGCRRIRRKGTPRTACGLIVGRDPTAGSSMRSGRIDQDPRPQAPVAGELDAPRLRRNVDTQAMRAHAHQRAERIGRQRLGTLLDWLIGRIEPAMQALAHRWACGSSADADPEAHGRIRRHAHARAALRRRCTQAGTRRQERAAARPAIMHAHKTARNTHAAAPSGRNAAVAIAASTAMARNDAPP